MSRYFVLHPRGFANEYVVYVVPDDEHAERLKAILPESRRDGLEEVSRAEAVRAGITRPREAKQSGEQWFGGLHAHPAGMTDERPWTNADRLAACEAVTVFTIEERESR